MKRAEIRAEIERAMAEKGYAPGLCSWRGAWFRAWRSAEPFDAPAVNVRLPSGISRKRFNQAIEAIEAMGPARPIPVRESLPNWRQTHIEDFLAA